MDAVGPLWECCHDHGLEGLEVEFRLGHALPGHFSPNVGKENFSKVRDVLNAAAYDSKFSVETVDRIAQHKHVTTLALDANPPPPPFCMTKTTVFTQTYPTETPYAIRCNIAIERIVPPVPPHNPRLVRHKKRTRYVFKEWAIDLTEVVSNSDVDSEETFEVEVELVDPTVLYEKPMDAVVKKGIGIVDDMLKFLSG